MGLAAIFPAVSAFRTKNPVFDSTDWTIVFPLALVGTRLGNLALDTVWVL